MEDLELIFTMLGERATTEIHRTENSYGVPKLKSDAKAGGDIAGGARKKLEKRLGKSIVSKKNYLMKCSTHLWSEAYYLNDFMITHLLAICRDIGSVTSLLIF